MITGDSTGDSWLPPVLGWGVVEKMVLWGGIPDTYKAEQTT